MTRHSRPAALSAIVAIVLSVAVAAAACGPEPAPAPPPAEPPTGDPQRAGVELGGLVTTGVDEGCAECHPEVVEAYRHSAMHVSMTLPTSPDTPESRAVGREVVDPATGIEIHFDLGPDGEKYVQRAVYRAPDGSIRARHTWPVDLVVGSGRAARSYFAVRDGLVFQLPLTWYRELDDMALSPGPGFRDSVLRFAPRLCVECHTGRVTPRSLVDELGFEGEISLGIACSRCHGDGTAHNESGDPLDIVNPARLDLRRQSEVCFQCHLTADLSLPVPGTSLAGFRPGDRLGEHVAVFGARRDIDAGAPISGHAARLEQSACATGDDALTCTTCHNPHAPADAPDTQGGCLVCHQVDSCLEPPHARAERSCASCHMRKVPSSDVEHTSTTDHLIARRPAVPPSRAGLEAGGVLRSLANLDQSLTNLLDAQSELPGAELRLAEAYLYGAERAAEVGGRPRGYLVRARKHLEAARRDHGSSAAFALAEARYLRMTERPAPARAVADALVARDPESIAALTAAGQARAVTGDLAGAIDLLGRAWERYPHAVHLPLTIAEAYSRAGNPAAALAVLDAAVARIGPSVPLSSRAVDAAEAAGRAADAVRHGLDLLILRPRDARLRLRVAGLAERAGAPADLIRSLRAR